MWRAFMKWLVRQMNNKLIKLLYNLDRQEGFMGMMLAMIMSVAIFTILSSVHIYTVNHAQYQSGIKEAYIMQTDVENFAGLVADAYNKGRDTCSSADCCELDTVPFKLGAGPCSSTEYKPANVCLTSSGGRGYCLVKLEAASLLGNPVDLYPPSTLPPHDTTQAKSQRDDLYQICSSPSPPLPTTPPPHDCSSSFYTTNMGCQNKCKKVIQIASRKNISVENLSTAVYECCGVARLSVINCNNPSNLPPTTCENYENNSSLTGEQRMWCENCEKENPNDANSKARLFTYYICPAKETSPGPPPVYDPDGYKCVTYMGGTDEKKAKSGVFYQTFRVLGH